MSGIMTIGNTGAIQVNGAINLDSARETKTSFTKMMGEHLRGVVEIPETPVKASVSSLQEKSESLTNDQIKSKLEASKGNETGKTANLEEKLSETKEAVKTKVKEVLGVSEEELEERMALLGMTEMDLLNPQKVFDLCLSLGDGDELSLLTDGELFSSISEILDQLQDMLKELGTMYQMNSKELETAFQEFHNRMETEPEIGDEVESLNPQEAQTEDVTLADGENQTDTKEEGSETKQEPSFMASETVADATPLEAKPMAANGVMPSYTTTSSQSIMDQMLQQLKLQVSPEVTELKMQLHPESLGNVAVQLTAKEGLITASFHTENEAVKNVLEAQMIQLKETLEEKGIQVEAVEVKVDTGAFQEQYEDQRDQESQEAFEKEIKRHQHRQINLMDYADAEGVEMEENDALTVKMMKENGNTLDYTA